MTAALFVCRQYFVFLLLIFCAQLAAGILAAIYSAEIRTFVSTELKGFLGENFNNTMNGTNEADNYANELATEAVKTIQQQVYTALLVPSSKKKSSINKYSGTLL